MKKHSRSESWHTEKLNIWVKIKAFLDVRVHLRVQMKEMFRIGHPQARYIILPPVLQLSKFLLTCINMLLSSDMVRA